jgi:tetratricopeptide (TPR) repeat protein
MRISFCHIIIALSLLLFTACGSAKQTSAGSDKSDKKGELSEADRIKFEQALFDGFTAKALNNDKEARAAFNRCLGIDPDNATVHFELARLDVNAGNLSSALGHLDIAAEKDIENVWIKKIRASVYFESGDFNTATKLYEELIEENPADTDLYFDLAAAHLYQEDADKAIDTYNDLEKIIGVNEELSLTKFQLYSELGDADKAEEELIALSREFPQNPDYLGILLEFYQQQGESEKAEQTLDKMVILDPENGQVQLYIAQFYSLRGEDEKSYQALKKAFEDPQVNIDQKVNILLGFASLDMVGDKERKKTAELLNILEKTHPGSAKVYALLGDFYYFQDKTELALENFHKAIELDPSRNTLWLQLLKIDMELNAMDQLSEDSRKAIELFPTQPEFYLYRGIALSRKGQHDEAIDALNTGRSFVFDNPLLLAEFYSTLGDVYHKTGDNDLSDQSYEESLKNDPDNPFVLNNYAYYLSLRKVKLEKARSMAEKANDILPGQASFIDTHAWILFRLGEFQSARDLQLKAIELNPDSGVLLEHLGDILFHLENKAQAMEYWNKALEKGGGSENLEEKIDQEKYLE